MQKRKFIAVIDDDESVREALPDLLRVLGYEAAGYSSAEEFLASDKLEQAECLVLDIAMPGMSGLDLRRELIRRGRNLPIIFITAYKEEAVRLRARERDGVVCLLKPFSDTALLEALRVVLGSK